jgi:hypothetical protein
VSGAAPSPHEKYQVIDRTPTTISYALPVNPGVDISGWTVTYPNILLFNAANCYPAAYGGSAPPARLSLSVR